MPEVRLQSINKSFNTTHVIRDASVDIADGEFCVLVGPSGSGKSTLLRLIAGLEEPDSGQIFIGPRNVTLEKPKSRDIAMVFQSYALYPQLSVRDNMGFGLRLAGVAKATIQAKVGSAAEVLSLTPLLDRLPKELSGGQRQRVAMGRAMVREPSVFLFDEPLSNLDASLRASVRSEIRAMHARSKTTSVYVTHDQVEAMTMGDRIVVLRGGSIEQVGTPVELYERPVNRFVASFIGSPAMNFFTLPIAFAPDHAFVTLGEHPVPLPSQISQQPTVDLGIRPEHLRLGLPSAGMPSLQATIASVEYTGAQSQVTVTTPHGPLVVTTNDRLAQKIGDATVVSLPPNSLHFFDGQSGMRLVSTC
jgi:multiple sugar transport system ATP-binding protein